MRPDRLRFVWPVLCVLLVAALAFSTVHWRKKLKTVSAQAAKKAKPKPIFDKRDAAYFSALAATLGYEMKPPVKPEDAARLAAYDRIELNKFWAMKRGGDPATFLTRSFAPTQQVTVPISSTVQASLAGPFEQYAYELINRSEHTLAAPILFQKDRWDSPDALVAHAGFAAIGDEVERAIAIWRFVCGRRVFGDPPTEGKEEHDVLKFLGVYGYGFCDDTARAVATLAELSGLRGRVWALDGHLVAEIFAGGKWRMFDADQQAYFHRAGAPQDVLGLEELSANRAAFEHMVSFRGATDYSPKFMDCILTRENNAVDPSGTSGHRLQPMLRAGESMTLTNYNWGRYFLGKFPTPPPRFYNGYFTYAFRPEHLAASADKITSEPIEGGYRLSNPSSETVSARVEFAYPFPVVGGVLQGAVAVSGGNAGLQLEDREHDRSLYPDLSRDLRVNLDRFVGVLVSEPTYHYALIFRLGPGAVMDVRGLQVTSDFQFSPLPLVVLRPGANEFQTHFPDRTDAAAFELKISTR